MHCVSWEGCLPEHISTYFLFDLLIILYSTEAANGIVLKLPIL